MKDKIYRLLQNLLKPITLVWQKYQRRGYKYIGKNVVIGKNFTGTERYNISIGDNTAIGPNCVFYAGIAPITVGRYVMISPNVTIVTGEHRTDIVGEYMRNITNDMKLEKHDKPVVIEDDVWIGSNVTILKGVTIGRGSIIHAGAIVTKRVRPYTIYIDDKTKINRFSAAVIQEHEKMLAEKYGVSYPPLDWSKYESLSQ